MIHFLAWDYKSLKWNLDGYISVPTSCIWGILGVIIIKWGKFLDAVSVPLLLSSVDMPCKFFLLQLYKSLLLCSVFTEIVFGTVFWDYSSIPFNLGGRINLLYCFFWGIAAVIWFKKGYPSISSLIEKIPKRIGKIITWFLISFMIANIFMKARLRWNTSLPQRSLLTFTITYF